jgi:DNA-binding transcriptional LysR family regulator
MPTSRDRRTPRTLASLDVRALEIFASVIDARSMTAAARHLKVTQPAVSAAVQQLERALGTALLDRSIRPLRPTAAGAVLRQRAGRILEDMRALRGAVTSAGRQTLPNIRIGLVASITALGAPLIVALQGLADELRIWSTLTPHLATGLRDRELDLLVTSDPMEDLPDLERRVVLHEPFVCAMPPDFAKIRRQLTLPMLVETLPMVRYTSRSRIGEVIEGYLGRRRLDVPHRLEFDSSASVLEMVSAGLGWAITTPLCILQSGVAVESVALRPIDLSGTARDLYVIARHNELPGTVARVQSLVATLAASALDAHFHGENRWVAKQVAYS